MHFKLALLLILAIISVHQTNGMKRLARWFKHSSSYTPSSSSSSTISSCDDSQSPEGVLHMRIENVSNWIGWRGETGQLRMLSEEPVFIRGLPWSLLVRIVDGHQLSISVQCNAEGVDGHIGWPRIANGWSCAAHMTIKVSGHTHKKEVLRHTFNAQQNARGMDKNVWLEDIMYGHHVDRDFYFVYMRSVKESDYLDIEVQVQAELPQGLKYFPVRERDISLRMRNLWETREGADVQFLVGTSKDNKQLISAHKEILSSTSDVFSAMFRFEKDKDAMEATEEMKPIVVDDIEADTFRIMLNYIYTDELSEINDDNLFDVMRAADKYILNGLLQACVDFPLETNKVLGLLNYAHLSGMGQLIGSATSLTRRCWDCVDRNIYAVLQSDQLPLVELGLLTELLGRNELMMSRRQDGEIALWRAAIRWTDEHCRQSNLPECSGQDRRQLLGPALFKIRFTLMDQATFAKEIVPSGVLTMEEMFSVFLYNANPDEHHIPELYPLKFCTEKRA